MTNLALSAEHLRKEFGEKVAVADLTLDVERGEIFGFLGPNGAGKTTSVKMLLSLTAPTSGEGQLLGAPLGDRATRAKVGYLPEHFRFHEWLRAYEFLDYHGRLFGMTKAEREEAIPRLLRQVGLLDRAETRLSAFSKGMIQRIGLAQALLNRPHIVFLDEPTSGLDPAGRKLVRDIISHARDEGTAVFLNSHLLSEVEKTCDRVAFIREGRILQVASLSEFDDEAFEVVLRVGQPTPALLGGLARFNDGGVAPAQLNGRIHLTVTDEAQLPAMAEWILAEGHSLYEFTPSRLSLEDRFLRVVGADTGE
jgi:ABC-2 type transport system ATP-binding protein